MPSGFSKEELLKAPVRHIDVKQLNIVPLIDQVGDTAFQARNLFFTRIHCGDG
jgi:deoxyhypusine synthase